MEETVKDQQIFGNASHRKAEIKSNRELLRQNCRDRNRKLKKRTVSTVSENVRFSMGNRVLFKKEKKGKLKNKSNPQKLRI